MLTYIADAAANVTGVTAAWMNSIRDRAMNVFQDDAARVLAVGLLPDAGRPFYYRSADEAEGLYLANTAGDVEPPWNIPWGFPDGTAPEVQRVSDVGPITSLADITGLAITRQAVANRNWLVTLECRVLQNTSAGTSDIYITDGLNNVLRRRAISQGAGEATTYVVTVPIVTTAGANTFKARASVGSGSLTVQAATAYPAIIRVEDKGPAGAPT